MSLESYGEYLPTWMKPWTALVVLAAASLWLIIEAWITVQQKSTEHDRLLRQANERADEAERNRDLWQHLANRNEAADALAELPHVPAAEELRERRRNIDKSQSHEEVNSEQENVIRLLRRPNCPWKAAPVGWDAAVDQPLLRQWAGLFVVMQHRYPGEITSVQRAVTLPRSASSELVGLIVREIEYPDWPRIAEPEDAFRRGVCLDYSGLQPPPAPARKERTPESWKEMKAHHDHGAAVYAVMNGPWPATKAITRADFVQWLGKARGLIGDYCGSVDLNAFEAEVLRSMRMSGEENPLDFMPTKDAFRAILDKFKEVADAIRPSTTHTSAREAVC